MVSPPRVVSPAQGLTTDATAALDGQQIAINVQLGERTRGPLDEGGRGDGSDTAYMNGAARTLRAARMKSATPATTASNFNAQL